MSPFRTLTLTTVASLLFIACGGGSPTPVTPAPTTASSDSASAAPSAASTDASAAPTVASAAPSASTPPPSAWSDTLSRHEKGAFMKATFSPTLGAVFKGHDASKYADFGCKTCHGADFKPNPRDFLPHLTVTADGKGLVEFKTKPAVAKFMATEVEEAAAKAFGKPPFDMKTGQGFGCSGCHTVDGMKK
jgi:hypothetical protein